MSFPQLIWDPQGEEDSETGVGRCMTDLTLDGELCALCSLLDLDQVFFGSHDYKLPVTRANFFGRWPNRFAWFLKHLRNESGCLLCRLVLEALQSIPSFDSSVDGIVLAWRSTLYSKEKDVSLPTFYILNIGLSRDASMGTSVENDGIAIGVVGVHQRRLRNSRDACLRHFYPYLPQGMVPMSTTDDQAKEFDEWRDKTGSEYAICVRSVNSGHVSTKVIGRWLKTCEEEHTKWCNKKIPQNAVIPNFRVIDLSTENIILAPPTCRYLALSYVWGKVHENNDYLRLMQANHIEMETPGAISKYKESLTDTINDAIHLCKLLNERYLWVDSLCIIQDSPVEQNEQISMMDIIYRHAVMTIVAAAGNDANAGLPGLRSELPRKPVPKSRIQSLDLIAFPQDGEFEVNASTWNTRAWTFQERALSTRLLRFTQSSVTFECLESCCREDLEIEGPEWDQFRLTDTDRHNQEIRENFHQIISDEILDFEKMVPRDKYTKVFQSIFQSCYVPLVRDYTKRKLTNENDMLNAFAGIQAALSKPLNRFYWGLPQHLLAASLSWIATSKSVSRRIEFPSWTWAGWIFGENTNVTYPDFTRGPHPGFVVFSEEGNITYWSSDCRRDPYIGIRPEHDRLLYPKNDLEAKEWDEILGDIVQNVLDRDDGLSLSSLLFFWTSTVPVQCGYDEKDAYSILKGVTVLRSKDKGILVGDTLNQDEFRVIGALPGPEYMELVYIGQSMFHSGKYLLILIRWTNGIARRIIPQVVFIIDAWEWGEANPKRNMIVLA